jgi:hypothetical protein
MNKFDDAMLARVPAMIDRIQPVMDGRNVEQKNALTLLQLGLEHFHPYIAGLLWVTGLEAIFDSGGREEFKKSCAIASALRRPHSPTGIQSPTRRPIRSKSLPFRCSCLGISSRMVQTCGDRHETSCWSDEAGVSHTRQ